MGSYDQPPTLIPDGGKVVCTDYHTETPLVVIARGISALDGCVIYDVPTLYDYIDPEALNRMMVTARDSKQDITVRVSVEEYTVTVDSDGTISIRDSDLDTDSS